MAIGDQTYPGGTSPHSYGSRCRREVAGRGARLCGDFDDITALVMAERKAAWADVARRIAHEIKNPLTPIQLASERLKRKYSREIKSDPDTFVACTETIIRQVEDIGRMVDEFSSFARMPRPELKLENLNELVRQAVFLERNRFPSIRVDLDIPEQPLELCDSRQVSQALINILKNAAEAVESRNGSNAVLSPGWIGVTVREEHTESRSGSSMLKSRTTVGVAAEENRDRLTEPYVTTRAKGTGLGLAIVKKVMEDHNGDLSIEDRDGGGARVSLIFKESRATLNSQDGASIVEVELQPSYAGKLHANG